MNGFGNVSGKYSHASRSKCSQHFSYEEYNYKTGEAKFEYFPWHHNN